MTYATIHTLRFIIVVTILSISFFLFTAKGTQAYLTTGQEAVPIQNGALFLIDYAFGNSKYDILMPLVALDSYERSRSAISYVVLDETGTRAVGKTAGFVWSQAPITKDGMYRTSKGQAAKFTLVVVFIPNATQPDTKQYRLQVTELPFSFDGTQELQLNPSELQYYTTPSLVLK